MGRLSEREKELVALGASLGCNCIPCVVYHVGIARQLGVADEEIEEVVELADKVRKVPAAQVLKTALAQIGKAEDESRERAESCKPGCEC